MHKFSFNRLPFSFTNYWVMNRERNLNRQLRNADDFFIATHHLESLKRLPLFSFPLAWNNADNSKLNQNENLSLKA